MGYLEILESYHDDMIKALKASVVIDSVQGAPVRTTKGELYPFGRGVQVALVNALELGDRLGFDTLNVDNYAGHIEWKAESGASKKEVFALAAHLDVVPVGNGWDTEPFEPVIKDGAIYGRGVSDDKGPFIASLYAMKALKEAGLKPQKNIRLILGLDEESEDVSIRRYIDRVGQPDLGFTPDGEFPVVNGEMGILIFELAQKLTKSNSKEGLRLSKIEAGTAVNIVPGSAKAVVASADGSVYDTIKDRAMQYAMETGFEIRAKKQGSSMVIEAKGLSAHGASPENGINAISILLDFLGKLQFQNEELNDFIAFYNEYIGFNLNGECIGCDLSDEPSGRLIWNVGLASFNDEVASVTVNVRYPVTCTEDEVYRGIEASIGNGRIGLIKHAHEAPVYMSEDSPLVVKLMEAYVEETGDTKNGPIVDPGGTYAKVLNNTIAFGALFPGELDTMHQANERLELESFYKMARIYATALYKTCF